LKENYSASSTTKPPIAWSHTQPV